MKRCKSITPEERGRQAREMKLADPTLTTSAIARYFGVNPSTMMLDLHPEKREQRRAEIRSPAPYLHVVKNPR